MWRKTKPRVIPSTQTIAEINAENQARLAQRRKQTLAWHKYLFVSKPKKKK